MTTAVISDIHGNLPALRAVLSAIDEAGIERIWCLGDIVGYGADPDGCAELVAARAEHTLCGNHDLGVLGEIDISTFSQAAATAARWTRDAASKATLDFLRSLKPAGTADGVGLSHGSPRDPVWEYVLSVEQAGECIAEQAEKVGLIGHSHVALFFVDLTAPDGDGTVQATPSPAGRPADRPAAVTGATAPAETSLDLSSGRWLLNPGSVGQPRDGDPRAAWLELDPSAGRATYHRVEYDISAAEAAIREAGLPESLGKRLHAGQ